MLGKFLEMLLSIFKMVWEQSHGHGIFKYSNRGLEIKFDPIWIEIKNILNFKNAQILYVASYWSPSICKNIGAFNKNALLFVWSKTKQRKLENRKQKEEKGKRESQPTLPGL